MGLLISLDYWWAGRGIDEVRTSCGDCSDSVCIFPPPQESKEYDRAIEPCHQRSADRILAGALKNGGLYIKLGQGLSTFNQVLPRQYTDTLKALQDMVCSIEFR